MKVELTENIVAVIEKCNMHVQELAWNATSINDPCFTVCSVCPLAGACCEYAGQKEAAANKAIANSLTDELIEYQWASHWDGKLPNVVGATTPIVDMGE